MATLRTRHLQHPKSPVPNLTLNSDGSVHLAAGSVGGGGGSIESTDELAEGATNLYYTDVRADARIAAAVLNALSDVHTAAPSHGASLIYNTAQSRWEPGIAGPEFTVSSSDTINVAFDKDRVITRTATGAITFTGSAYNGGKSASIRIVPGASNRNLTFPAGWKFLSFKPTSVLANKTGVLALTSYGTAEAHVVAAWAVEP
jgi:hypothetical protein